jgi:hypothetical protein
MNPVNRMEIERDEFMKNSNNNDDSNEIENNNFDKRMPARDGYHINEPIYINNKSNHNNSKNQVKSFNQYSDFADIDADTKLSDNINTTKMCINGINNYGLFLFDNMLNMMNSAFIFSPYLIYSIFASLFMASDGNTEIELKNYFNFPRTDQLSSGLHQLESKIKTIGNCIIFSQDIDYNPQFCKNINTFTKIRKVNTDNFIAETDNINNIIKNISNLSKKSINIDTIKNCSVALLNFAYLNPKWTSHFSKIIKMNNIDYIIAINEMFGYYEHNGLQVLEINSTNNICFGIIYGDIELNDKTYNHIISNLKPTILNEVMIPKFSISTKLRYKNLLKETDLKTIFIDLKCPYIFNSECEISDCLQNIEFHFTENSVKTKKINSIKTNKKFIIEKSFRFYVRTTENVVLFFGSY